MTARDKTIAALFTRAKSARVFGLCCTTGRVCTLKRNGDPIEKNHGLKSVDMACVEGEGKPWEKLPLGGKT